MITQKIQKMFYIIKSPFVILRSDLILFKLMCPQILTQFTN